MLEFYCALNLYPIQHLDLYLNPYPTNANTILNAYAASRTPANPNQAK